MINLPHHTDYVISKVMKWYEHVLDGKVLMG